VSLRALAKQSSRKVLDCFVASLLAMTTPPRGEGSLLTRARSGRG
jgi:hypothetical protein